MGKYFILIWRVIENIRLSRNKISCDVELTFKGILANIHVKPKKHPLLFFDSTKLAEIFLISTHTAILLVESWLMP